jgi:hypothetical protein
MRCKPPSGFHRLFRIADEAEDRPAMIAPHACLRPDRLDRELVRDLGRRAAQMRRASRDGDRAENPAPGLAERAVDAAEQLEILVERADRLALGQVPGDVAPDEKPPSVTMKAGIVR